MQLAEILPDCKFGIRPHPEFPVRRLSPSQRDWISRNHFDLTGSSLSDNLAWCDVLVYVSSTVAIEALMWGIPVVNLDIGDYLDPDPVVDSLEFRFKARTVAELAAAINNISSFSDNEYSQHAHAAIQYANAYLTPANEERLKKFLL